MYTDVLGAKNALIDSILITDGVHAEELGLECQGFGGDVLDA
eukprot:CAMPEP_0197531230 /NCGR_PEP_ID=MMETSP1318-20131121/34727_1 /TAXON_ID=552666 /ORGANISM="Partenskyella glossopodia, Strain RCC365" /LENGTH=41 /DNA_ID= /DNA_START= /DNA_END= /DNA_ORIENTATION=